ncbi:MAG: hypothetical protein WAT12_11565 [Candidatus Nitrotoga sp.]
MVHLHLLWSTLALIGAIWTYLAAEAGQISYFSAYLTLNGIILGYCGAQAWLVYQKHPEKFLLNPTIHTAIVGNIFLLVIGGSGFILPMEWGGFIGELDIWFVMWMTLYAGGMVALWSGYWSRWAVKLGHRLRSSASLKRVLRPEFRVNPEVLWLFFGVGVACILAMITLGIYGYSRDPFQAERYVGIQQYLTIGRDLVPLVLLVLALQFFSGGQQGRRALLGLSVVFLISVFAGFLSGFKSQVVMPILIVGLAHYVVRDRIPNWMLPIGIVLLLSAYSVIEPFRDARKSDAQFQSQNLFYIVEVMFGTENASGTKDSPALQDKASHFVSAQSPIALWSRGLEYHAWHDGLPASAPGFGRNILLSPLLAVVPRAIWPGKPEAIYGNWYYVEVLGNFGETSVSISGVTSLYFVGGWPAVMIGFFVFGMLQRGLFQGLVPLGAGGVLVFLGLFSGLRGFEVFHVLIVDLLRTLPLMLLVQSLLLKKSAARPSALISASWLSGTSIRRGM